MNNNIKQIINEISPLRRMINSQGMDNAFKIVQKYLPTLKIHEYQPGVKADDWEVPYGWELVRAYIKDASGKVIASDNDSHLFVAAYSEPVKGKFSKGEIEKHIRCHPIRKDA